MILQLAKKYKNLVILSAGLKMHTYCQSFSKFFPDRYFSFGLAEANVASAAAGFALKGKLPLIVADKYFVGRAWEQIRNDICEPNLNVKIVVDGGELLAEADEVEEDLALVAVLPNIEVFSIKGWDEKIFSKYGPAYVRLADI